MRARLVLGILTLCVCGPGCHLVGRATHNVAFEVGRSADCVAETVHACKLADEAWRREQCSPPAPQPASKHYVKGFKDGFTDFVLAGGTGQPPPVPPPHYWKSCYLTPQGH